jgi:hypothetical protein
MMKVFARFNIYLCCALALVSLAAGCRSSEKKKKDLTIIELHQEVTPDGASDNKPVTIFREHPINVNVDISPFVDTPDVDEAKLIDDFGGFMIQLKFNWRGTQLLNSITTANRGRRIAVFCRFPEPRWLASPVVQRSISDGTFTFTPDATRAEAERIVKGLNEVIAEFKKKG